MVNAIAGLFAVFVAGLSVYLVYRVRRQPYWNVLYEKQLEACNSILATAFRFNSAAQDCLSSREGIPTTVEEGNEPWKIMSECVDELMAHNGVLPSELVREICDYTQWIQHLVNDEELATDNTYAVLHNADRRVAVDQALLKLANRCRALLGVDRLTLELCSSIKTVQLLGPQRKDERIR